jgi:hypothetical protein
MNLFAPALPLLVFLLLWGIFYKVDNEWRAAFMSAAIMWGVLLTAATEILSLFKAISFWPVLGAWGIYLMAAILCWVKVIGSPKNLIKNLEIPHISRFEFLLLGGVVLIASAVGFIAVIAPPNTYDAMTYHMARVMHWIQDGSLDYYPTQELRQLYLNPWSEFTILHFQVLAGTDRLANSVQWFSMIGSTIGVTLIAKELGANRKGQIFSAAVSMTIPMGILQGSSTENDYVAAFWLICFVSLIFVLKDRGDFWSAFASGASLGLATLTKATAYIYAFPFVAWSGVWTFKAYRYQGLKLLGIIAFGFLAINLGYYTRNTNLFSNPLAITQEISPGQYTIPEQYSSEIFSIPELLSNIARNIAVQLGTPFENINRFLENAVYQFHGFIGISPNDPRTTFSGEVFHVNRLSFHEDWAGNLLHVLLIMITIILVGIYLRRNRKLIYYFLCLNGAFLFFCIYLMWQPWVSRLELPLFVLWSPLIGMAILSFRAKWIAPAILLLLILGAMPWVLFNQTRPILGTKNIFNTSRDEQYFNSNDRQQLENSYSWAARYMAEDMKGQCRDIGLYLSEDDWEYPLWILLRQKIGKEVRIEAVNVENISAHQYGEFPEFTPCAVIALNPLSVDGFQVNGTAYSVRQTIKSLKLLLPK